MDALPILVIVVVGLLLITAWFLRRKARGPAGRDAADRLDTVVGWPPSPTRVLGKGEILAYKVLARALPGHMILAKVPLARFLDVPSRHSYAEWLRRLGYQCADLVVCDMAAEVVAVVNVRRSAAQMSERAVKRHQRMAKVLKKAGIALYDWVDDALPTPERAREMLLPGATDACRGDADRSGTRGRRAHRRRAARTAALDLVRRVQLRSGAAAARPAGRRGQLSSACANSRALKVCRSSSFSPTPMK